MSKRIVVCSLVLVGLVLITVPGCGSKVSKANFDKITTGMTMAEVQKILGKGEAQASAGGAIGGMVGAGSIYKWTDGDKSITVTFVNDKVTAMASNGL